MQKNILETVLGAIVLVVSVGFLLFAYKTADLKPIEGYQINAKFTGSIDGLKVGSLIKLKGVRIGKVLGFKFTDGENYNVLVQLNIATNIKLPLDTVAVVSSEGLLGGKYLSLELGGDEDMLEAGDSIEYTQSTPSLEKLLGQAVFSMSKGSKNE